MKKQIFFFLIIGSLLLINGYILIRFNTLKKEKVKSETPSYNTRMGEELKIYNSKFAIGILNSDFDLDNIKVKDTLNNLITLQALFKGKQSHLLVCRFSRRHCESCVDAMIHTLLQRIDSIGKNNVIFLGNHSNNRVFKSTLPLYNIEGLKVYNTPTLNLPVEDLGYPYLFILNRGLQTSNVFVHEKGYPQLTIEYLENINNRFFDDEK